MSTHILQTIYLPVYSCREIVSASGVTQPLSASVESFRDSLPSEFSRSVLIILVLILSAAIR